MADLALGLQLSAITKAEQVRTTVSEKLVRQADCLIIQVEDFGLDSVTKSEPSKGFRQGSEMI